MSHRGTSPRNSFSPTSGSDASSSGIFSTASATSTQQKDLNIINNAGPSTLVGITANTKEDWSVDFDLSEPLVLLRGGGGGSSVPGLTAANSNDKTNWDGKKFAPHPTDGSSNNHNNRKVHHSSTALLQSDTEQRSSDSGVYGGNKTPAQQRSSSMRLSADWKLPTDFTDAQLNSSDLPPPSFPRLETLMSKEQSSSSSSVDGSGSTSANAREDQRLVRVRMMEQAGVANAPPSPMLTGNPLPRSIVTPDLDWSQEHGRAHQLLSRLLSRGSVHFDTGDYRWQAYRSGNFSNSLQGILSSLKHKNNREDSTASLLSSSPSSSDKQKRDQGDNNKTNDVEHNSTRVSDSLNYSQQEETKLSGISATTQVKHSSIDAGSATATDIATSIATDATPAEGTKTQRTTKLQTEKEDVEDEEVVNEDNPFEEEEEAEPEVDSESSFEDWDLELEQEAEATRRKSMTRTQISNTCGGINAAFQAQLQGLRSVVVEDIEESKNGGESDKNKSNHLHSQQQPSAVPPFHCLTKTFERTQTATAQIMRYPQATKLYSLRTSKGNLALPEIEHESWLASVGGRSSSNISDASDQRDIDDEAASYANINVNDRRWRRRRRASTDTSTGSLNNQQEQHYSHHAGSVAKLVKTCRKAVGKAKLGSCEWCIRQLDLCRVLFNEYREYDMCLQNITRFFSALPAVLHSIHRQVSLSSAASSQKSTKTHPIEFLTVDVVVGLEARGEIAQQMLLPPWVCLLDTALELFKLYLLSLATVVLGSSSDELLPARGAGGTRSRSGHTVGSPGVGVGTRDISRDGGPRSPTSSAASSSSTSTSSSFGRNGRFPNKTMPAGSGGYRRTPWLRTRSSTFTREDTRRIVTAIDALASLADGTPPNAAIPTTPTRATRQNKRGSTASSAFASAADDDDIAATRTPMRQSVELAVQAIRASVTAYAVGLINKDAPGFSGGFRSGNSSTSTSTSTSSVASSFSNRRSRSRTRTPRSRNSNIFGMHSPSMHFAFSKSSSSSYYDVASMMPVASSLDYELSESLLLGFVQAHIWTDGSSPLDTLQREKRECCGESESESGESVSGRGTSNGETQWHLLSPRVAVLEWALVDLCDVALGARLIASACGLSADVSSFVKAVAVSTEVAVAAPAKLAGGGRECDGEMMSPCRVLEATHPVVLQADALCAIQLIMFGKCPLQMIDNPQTADAVQELEIVLESRLERKQQQQQQQQTVGISNAPNTSVDVVDCHSTSANGSAAGTRDSVAAAAVAAELGALGDGLVDSWTASCRSRAVKLSSLPPHTANQINNLTEQQLREHAQGVCSVDPSARMHALLTQYHHMHTRSIRKAKAAYVAGLLTSTHTTSPPIVNSSNNGNNSIATTDMVEQLLFEALFLLDENSSAQEHNYTDNERTLSPSISMTVMPVMPMPALLSGFGFSVLMDYGDALLDCGKYRYAIVAYESAAVVFRRAYHCEPTKLLRRLCSVCVENHDWDRALMYHMDVLQACAQADNVNEVVFLSERIATLLVDTKADFTGAVEILCHAIEFVRPIIDINTANTNTSTSASSSVGSGGDGGGDVHYPEHMLLPPDRAADTTSSAVFGNQFGIRRASSSSSSSSAHHQSHHHGHRSSRSSRKGSHFRPVSSHEASFHARLQLKLVNVLLAAMRPLDALAYIAALLNTTSIPSPTSISTSGSTSATSIRMSSSLNTTPTRKSTGPSVPTLQLRRRRRDLRQDVGLFMALARVCLKQRWLYDCMVALDTVAVISVGVSWGTDHVDSLNADGAGVPGLAAQKYPLSPVSDSVRGETGTTDAAERMNRREQEVVGVMRAHLGAMPSGIVISYVVLLARCLAHRRFFVRALAWIDQLLWLAGVDPSTGSAAASATSASTRRAKRAHTKGVSDNKAGQTNSNSNNNSNHDFPQIGLPLSKQGKLFYVKGKILTMWINCCAPLAHGVRGARLGEDPCVCGNNNNNNVKSDNNSACTCAVNDSVDSRKGVNARDGGRAGAGDSFGDHFGSISRACSSSSSNNNSSSGDVAGGRVGGSKHRATKSMFEPRAASANSVASMMMLMSSGATESTKTNAESGIESPSPQQLKLLMPCAQAYWNGYQYFSLINDIAWQAKTLTCVAQTEMHVAMDCAAAGLLQNSTILRERAQYRDSESSTNSNSSVSGANHTTDVAMENKQANKKNNINNKNQNCRIGDIEKNDIDDVNSDVNNARDEDNSAAAYRAALSRNNSSNSGNSMSSRASGVEHNSSSSKSKSTSTPKSTPKSTSTSTYTIELASRRLPELMLERCEQPCHLAMDLCAELAYPPLVLRSLLNVCELSVLKGDSGVAQSYWHEAYVLMTGLYLTPSPAPDVTTNPGTDAPSSSLLSSNVVIDTLRVYPGMTSTILECATRLLRVAALCPSVITSQAHHAHVVLTAAVTGDLAVAQYPAINSIPAQKRIDKSNDDMLSVLTWGPRRRSFTIGRDVAAHVLPWTFPTNNNDSDSSNQRSAVNNTNTNTNANSTTRESVSHKAKSQNAHRKTSNMNSFESTSFGVCVGGDNNQDIWDARRILGLHVSGGSGGIGVGAQGRRISSPSHSSSPSGHPRRRYRRHRRQEHHKHHTATDDVHRSSLPRGGAFGKCVTTKTFSSSAGDRNTNEGISTSNNSIDALTSWSAQREAINATRTSRLFSVYHKTKRATFIELGASLTVQDLRQTNLDMLHQVHTLLAPPKTHGGNSISSNTHEDFCPMSASSSSSAHVHVHLGTFGRIAFGFDEASHTGQRFCIPQSSCGGNSLSIDDLAWLSEPSMQHVESCQPLLLTDTSETDAGTTVDPATVDARHAVGDEDLLVLARSIGLDALVRLWTLIVAERPVVFVSESALLRAVCVRAASQFIAPLQWSSSSNYFCVPSIPAAVVEAASCLRQALGRLTSSQPGNKNNSNNNNSNITYPTIDETEAVTPFLIGLHPRSYDRLWGNGVGIDANEKDEEDRAPIAVFLDVGIVQWSRRGCDDYTFAGDNETDVYVTSQSTSQSTPMSHPLLPVTFVNSVTDVFAQLEQYSRGDDRNSGDGWESELGVVNAGWQRQRPWRSVECRMAAVTGVYFAQALLPFIAVIRAHARTHPCSNKNKICSNIAEDASSDQQQQQELTIKRARRAVSRCFVHGGRNFALMLVHSRLVDALVASATESLSLLSVSPALPSSSPSSSSLSWTNALYSQADDIVQLASSELATEHISGWVVMAAKHHSNDKEDEPDLNGGVEAAVAFMRSQTGTTATTSTTPTSLGFSKPKRKWCVLKGGRFVFHYGSSKVKEKGALVLDQNARVALPRDHAFAPAIRCGRATSTATSTVTAVVPHDRNEGGEGGGEEGSLVRIASMGSPPGIATGAPVGGGRDSKGNKSMPASVDEDPGAWLRVRSGTREVAISVDATAEGVGWLVAVVARLLRHDVVVSSDES